MEYSAQERFWLWTLAVVGAVGLNTAFMYGLLVRPELLNQAMSNPVSLAFIIESLLLMCAFAYLLGKWGVSRMHWGWFVGLSLLGSMALALPVVLLSKRRS
jgi:Kef-type K+ transport system membrane component KefB